MRKIRHWLRQAFSLRTLLLLVLGVWLAPAAVDLDRMLLLASQRYGDAADSQTRDQSGNVESQIIQD